MAPPLPAKHRQHCHLFRLPLELRQHIYSYLLPDTDDIKFTPIPSVGITSVSPQPPSISLLRIHSTITEDLLDHFYSISTWKIVCAHSYNLFRIDPEFQKLGQSRILTRIRRVEIEFFLNGLVLRDYPNTSVKSLTTDVGKRCTSLCEALLKATNLRTIIVSSVDMTSAGSYAHKSEILRPLRQLCMEGANPDLTFHLGTVVAPNDVEKEEFAAALRIVVSNRLEDYKRRVQPVAVSGEVHGLESAVMRLIRHN